MMTLSGRSSHKKPVPGYPNASVTVTPGSLLMLIQFLPYDDCVLIMLRFVIFALGAYFSFI